MRRIEFKGQMGSRYTVTITAKRPKTQSAVKGMARLGFHDMIIRQTLGITAMGFRRLRRRIVADLAKPDPFR
jgi:transposase-like protein